MINAVAARTLRGERMVPACDVRAWMVLVSVSIIQIQFSSYSKWIKNRNKIQMCGKFLYYYKQNEQKKKSLIYMLYFFGFLFSLIFIVAGSLWHTHSCTRAQNNRAWVNANRNKSILILPKTTKRARVPGSRSDSGNHIAGVLDKEKTTVRIS